MSTNVPRSGFFQKTVDHATENFKGYFLPASDYVSIFDFILERNEQEYPIFYAL